MKFLQKLVDKFHELTKFLREVRSEMRKVVWPTRQQTVNYTLVVVAAVILVAGLISITDAAFGAVIRRVLGI
ncbi:MAG: preprotein translocase subunit SecE [Selenomonadales bacterium]|jgi:preprotein translocase subunit SecE|nr:preprotein translocase subunit SecE [Selenomonadales bacterium]